MTSRPRNNKPLLLAIFLHLIIILSSVYFAWNYYHQQLSQVAKETQSTLSLDVGIKKTRLDKHFTTTETEILFLANTGALKLALDTLKTSWAELGKDANKKLQTLYIEDNPHIEKSKLTRADTDTNYNLLHESIHILLYELKKKRHYTNIFLLDMQGNILYDVEKGNYFASNIENKTKHISKVFSEVKENPQNEYVSFIDFSPHDGSYFATALSDERGEKIGVLIFQMNQKTIETISLLEPIDKNECTDKSTIEKSYFIATTCLEYKENYWLIRDKESQNNIYAPVKESVFKHIAILCIIGLLSLTFGYIILSRFLGRQSEEEDE
jgi:hypothetical protein